MLTLAKFVISAIPAYTMQTMWLPSNVCDAIDISARNFIWREKSDRACRWSLVNWDVVTGPRILGSLGICKVCWFNTTLLGKIIWDMLTKLGKI